MSRVRPDHRGNATGSPGVFDADRRIAETPLDLGDYAGPLRNGDRPRRLALRPLPVRQARRPQHAPCPEQARCVVHPDQGDTVSSPPETSPSRGEKHVMCTSAYAHRPPYALTLGAGIRPHARARRTRTKRTLARGDEHPHRRAPLVPLDRMSPQCAGQRWRRRTTCRERTESWCDRTSAHVCWTHRASRQRYFLNLKQPTRQSDLD